MTAEIRSSYCVRVKESAPDAQRRLRQWGFRWNPAKRAWERYFETLLPAQSLARDLRDRQEFWVSLHECEPPKPADPFKVDRSTQPHARRMPDRYAKGSNIRP